MKLIISLILVLISTSIHAESFKWVDENGTTHFTDYPPPDNQTNHETKSGRFLQDQTQQNPSSDLTQEDLRFIDLLKENGLLTNKDLMAKPTHKQLIRYKEYLGLIMDINSIGKPPDPRYSSPEKTFQLYKDSLIKGDVELAVSCFTVHRAKDQREILKALGKDVLKKVAENMQPIEKITQDDRMAEYTIVIIEDGKNMSYDISFINTFGNWKIEQF